MPLGLSGRLSGTLTRPATATVKNAASAAAGSGYWHTSGRDILDSNNQPVRIAGVTHLE